MKDMNYFNSDEYIIAKILRINNSLKFDGVVELYLNNASSSETVKKFKFKTESSTELVIYLRPEGFLSFMFSQNKDNFMFGPYLEKYDHLSRVQYEDVLSKCRGNNIFHENIQSILDFTVDYIGKSKDLQDVLEGNKWFEIPFDFNGMK
jgi:hypothetical protein